MTGQRKLGEFEAESVEKVPSKMENWETKTIEEVCIINPSSINDGFEHDEMKYLNISSTGEGYIKEYQYHDIDDAPSRAKRTISSGDTVISTVRPGRKQHVYMSNPDDNLVVSTGFVVLRPKNKEQLDNRFLYYAATRPELIKYFEKNATGSAYPAVNLSIVRDGEIPVPPLDQQKRIADILSSLEEKIDTNNRIIEILEEITQTLYKSWFIDFEPYDTFKQSKLGKIPVDFEVRNLTDIAEVTYGYGFDSDKFNEEGEGYPVIRNGDLPNDNIRYSTQKYFNEDIDAKYEILPGDLVVTMDRYFDPYIWKGEPAALNQRICKFEGVSNKYSNLFLYHSIKKPIDKIEQAKTGTTLPHLGKSDIDNIEVIIPDDDSLQRFNDIAANTQQELIELSKEIRHLADLRDMLVPKLMSGDVSLSLENTNQTGSKI